MDKSYKSIKAGIRLDGNDFVIDFSADRAGDIISLVSPTLYQSTITNRIYWFGYKFNDDISSYERTEATRWIKGIADKKIDDSLLGRLIDRPLGAVDRLRNLTTFDCIVYPRSDRSNLTRLIKRRIANFIGHNTHIKSFELIKSVPKDISFNWAQFDFDFAGTSNQYAQIRNYVDNVMLPKIHDLTYFSIAENVKAKYRPYIKDYLQFGSEEEKTAFESLQGQKILVIDDINSTQSTLNEILRVIKTINSDNDIYVFTLLGKE